MGTKLFGDHQPGGMFYVQDRADIPGNAYWVSSSAGTDSSGYGRSPDSPVASIDYAISNLCTANNGDFIFVLPGHTEDFASGETTDADIAGITIEGLGTGSLRPRLDFNHATAGFDIGANNVTLRNLTFRPSVATVAIGVDIEAGKTGCVIENCEFLPGEAGDGTDEFVISIDVKAGCNDTIIRNNTFRTHASCNGCSDAIKLTGASHRVKILDNYATGNYSTAGITGDTTLSTDVLIKGNVLKVKDGEPGIQLLTGTTGILDSNHIESTGVSPDAAIVADACSWIENYCVAADGAAATLIGDPSDEASNYIGTDSANNAVATSSVAANEDGSVLERLEHIQEVVNKGTGTALGANLSLIDMQGVKSAETALLANTATGSTDLFTLDGSVELIAIIGIVQTTEMAAAQTRVKLQAQSDSLSATDICAALDLTGDAVGTTYNITGTFVDAMVAATNGVAIAQAGSVVIPVTTSGKILANNADAANAGRIKWQVLYRPLSPGATITAA